jgi:transportin-3
MHFVNILSSRTPVELNGSLFLVGLLPYVFIFFLLYTQIFFFIVVCEANANFFFCYVKVYKSFGDVIGSYSKWLSSSQSNIRPLL